MKAEQSCKDEAEQCALISPKVGELSCSTGGSRVEVENKIDDGKVQALEDDDEEEFKRRHGLIEDEEVENVEEAEEDEYGLGQEATGKPRIPKGLRAPEKVSKKEKEEHCLTHTPFKPWCRYCVRGRGKNMQHRKKKQEDKEEEVIPRISMDYHFLSQADEEACANPMFVMVDEETGDKYAWAGGMKGVGDEGELDWLIKDISEEWKAWGHMGGASGCLIAKCDNENSIKAVRDKVAKYHGGRVIPENPEKGESQSNGRVEEAGKTVREFTRVL